MDSNFELEHLYSTQNDFEAVSTSKKSLIHRIRPEENQCASNTKYLFGSFKIPLEKKIDVSGLIVALDSIRDPGNLGQF
jgi:TrmH family RNA methyltransferase